MHGEHNGLPVLLAAKIGSPPYARGTPLPINGKIADCRITPVCTGNTVGRFDRYNEAKDHPRMHGEHLKKLIILVVSVGSPPYARGTLNKGDSFHGLQRITPVCTGNTAV